MQTTSFRRGYDFKTKKDGTRAPRGVGSSADRCRGQEEGGGRCEKQGVCRLTRGMENRRPCFEVGRSNPSFSGKDINAYNSKRNLQGCLFLFSKEKMEPEGRAEDAKNKKEISFPMEKTAKPLSLRPLLQFCKGGTA